MLVGAMPLKFCSHEVKAYSRLCMQETWLGKEGFLSPNELGSMRL